MSSEPISASRFFVRSSAPFRLLGIEPATPDAEIDAAAASAIARKVAEEATILQAYVALKDPESRLLAELCYPLDCPPKLLASFYAGIDAPSIDEALTAAAGFPPITRANFVAATAVRLGMCEKTLATFIDSYAAIDAMEVYQVLQKVRRQAGIPSPSLMRVRQGITDHLRIHCALASASIASVHKLMPALLEERNAIVGAQDRGRAEIFSTLLEACSALIEQALSQAGDQVRIACESVRAHIEDGSQVRGLSAAFYGYGRLSEIANQLLHRYPSEDGIWTDFESLLRSLLDTQQFKIAQQITTAVVDVLRPFPVTHSQATAITGPFERQLLLEDIASLETLLERFNHDPASIARALLRAPFGTNSPDEAGQLWSAFNHAVAATATSPDLCERPWLLIHRFALALSDFAGTEKEGRSVLTGAIHFGEREYPHLAVLDLLRADLATLKGLHDEQSGVGRGRSVKKVTVALFGTIIFLLIGVLSFGYLNDRFSATAVNGPTPVPAAPRDRELLPAAGTGQRYPREHVRYCHYQEERLRIVKQHVRGQEDIRAYNALANDYNSRCSDYLYQIEDFDAVRQEVSAKRKMLEEDALKILATWSWRIVSPTQTERPSK